MLRIIFNDGIMEHKPLEVLELLPAGDKLYSELWRLINDRAMCMAAREAETGLVGVYVYRVRDEEDPWFRFDRYCTPYGELICAGMADLFGNEISMVWKLPGQLRLWTYRTVNIKPEEECYHD